MWKFSQRQPDGRSGIVILVRVGKAGICGPTVWNSQTNPMSWRGRGDEYQYGVGLGRPEAQGNLAQKWTQTTVITRSIFTFCLSSPIRKWCANVWFPYNCYKFSSIFDFCTIHYREWGWCRYFGHFCSLWMHLRRSLLIQIARKYLKNAEKVLLGGIPRWRELLP